MPRFRRTAGREIGALTVAVAMWDMWRRIPRKHRKRIVAQVRKHGPRIAREAYRARSRLR